MKNKDSIINHKSSIINHSVVFFGSSKYVIPILEELKDKLCLIVTTEKETTEPVIDYSIKNNIPYLSVSIFDNSLKSYILSLKAEIAVLADFGLKLPSDIITAFPKGIVNIHPSLLPEYRGPTPVQTAILNRNKVSGVTLMLLDDKIDHGPIIDQQKESILETDTADSLYANFFKIGADLLTKNLEKYINGEIKLKEQDDSKATYSKTLNRQCGYFDLKNPPKKKVLERMIKAFYPWPGAWTVTRYEGKDLRVKFLPNNKIQVEGKKPTGYKDFQNGYPILYNEFSKILK